MAAYLFAEEFLAYDFSELLSKWALSQTFAICFLFSGECWARVLFGGGISLGKMPFESDAIDDANPQSSGRLA